MTGPLAFAGADSLLDHLDRARRNVDAANAQPIDREALEPRLRGELVAGFDPAQISVGNAIALLYLT